MKIRAFACSWPKGPLPHHEEIINRATAGQARYAYLIDLRDCWGDVTFADIKVRVAGPPVTSEAFVRNAIYRGIVDWRVGHRVRLKRAPEWTGAIVAHNAAANLDILFDGGPSAGQVLNCHPAELERVST